MEDDSQSDDEDDHNFQVGLSFGRSECNFNPLFGGNQTDRSTIQQSEQSTNPLEQGGNINELNLENLFANENLSTEYSSV